MERIATLRELAEQAEPLSCPRSCSASSSAFSSAGRRRSKSAGARPERCSAEALQERALNEAAAYAHPHRRGRGAVAAAAAPRRNQRGCCKAGGEIGKRLDFLIQELQREANTLGSKSAALELTQISVEMKVAIEQMREQVQNIE